MCDNFKGFILFYLDFDNFIQHEEVSNLSAFKFS